jgi:hypothetical protein
MARTDHPAFRRYVYVSAYQLHLERFLAFFPREQLWVYLHDDLQSDARAFVRQLYEELGVDPEFTPANLGKRYNPARSPRLPGLQRLLERAALFQRKHALLRNSQWVSSFGQLFVKMNSIRIQRSAIQPELRERLIGQFNETIDYVENWLERPLPKWRQVSP